MLHSDTITEITKNTNTGIEYEIALFYKLSSLAEQKTILEAINKRQDKNKVLEIINRTDIEQIVDELQRQGLKLCNVTFETQNDKVGPSDIVMLVRGANNEDRKIGISVKYDNNCTCNCSYHYFLSSTDKDEIKSKLPDYVSKHIEKMNEKYGDISLWFRNRKCSYSGVANEYINLIRDKVIDNWNRKTTNEKIDVLSTLLQTISPIEYWVYTFNKNNTINLNTQPFSIAPNDIDRVLLTKNAGQFIQFSIDSQVFAQMQVKFNNGIIERCKYKQKSPDIVYDGVRIKYGDSFGSWNFSVIK